MEQFARPTRPGPIPLLLPCIGLALGATSGLQWRGPSGPIAVGALAILVTTLVPGASRVCALAIVVGWGLLGAALSIPPPSMPPPSREGPLLVEVRLRRASLDDLSTRREAVALRAWAPDHGGVGAPIWEGPLPMVIRVVPSRVEGMGRGSTVLCKGQFRLERDGRLALHLSRNAGVFATAVRSVSPILHWIHLGRRRLRWALGVNAPVRVRSLFLALTLGDRSELEPKTSASFQRTGTAHLLAISGLHVGLCWWGARWLLQKALSFGPRRWVRQGGAVVGACVLAWGVSATYVLAAGAPVSGLRALGMLAAVTLARALRRRASPWNVLAFGIMAVIAGDPTSVGALGFQLSVASVACLIAATTSTDAREGLWWTVARFFGLGLWTGLVGTCATAPLVGRTWGQIPIAGVWSNAVAVPLLGAATLPPLLLGSVLSAVHPQLGEGLILIAGFTAGVGLDLIAWFAVPTRAPQLSWQPSGLTTIVLYTTVLFFFLRWRRR